jgi:hypothetical protein
MRIKREIHINQVLAQFKGLVAVKQMETIQRQSHVAKVAAGNMRLESKLGEVGI